MNYRNDFLIAMGIVGLLASEPVLAQSSDSSTETEQVTTEAGTSTDDNVVAPDTLLTSAELETLVAPVALYPDTLLIQILVAATVPLEVMKADRFVATYASDDPEALQKDIEDQGWDPSVAVLATAFPTVLSDMADHIEWTESIGLAMQAQDEDVMEAVQRMRDQAINSGALISNEQQTVVSQDDAVVITPTEPNVVYVPTYDTKTVYEESNSNDALTTGLILLTTFVLIDHIFDDDDDWNGYWGCRNCGGWGGQPIYNNPNIDININGDVNIGNKVNIDKGWKPSDRDHKNAQDKIANRRGSDGKTKLTTKKSNSKSSDLRNKLTKTTGSRDISKGGAKNLPQIDKQKASARKTPINKSSKAKPVKRAKSPTKKANSRTATKPAKRNTSAMR
ncbi:MAG: DUF3300 domain-containing protein, partial [Amylibacter sp.]